MKESEAKKKLCPFLIIAEMDCINKTVYCKASECMMWVDKSYDSTHPDNYGRVEDGDCGLKHV